VLPAFALRRAVSDRIASRILIVSGAMGVVTVVMIALAIDIGGWTWPPLAAVFGSLRGRQPGLGYGAFVVSAAALMLTCYGLALRGWVRGDPFIASAIGAAVALVGLFTVYPLTRLLARAFVDADG